MAVGAGKCFFTDIDRLRTTFTYFPPTNILIVYPWFHSKALGQTEGGPRLTDGNGILAKLRMNETDCTAHKHISDLQHSVQYSRQVTSV